MTDLERARALSKEHWWAMTEESLQAIADLVGAARREGAEEMRERAAQVVEDYFNPETCGPCAAAIRALKAA